MLFVEGEPRSLDAAIYGLLLPGVTVNAKGSSVKVIRAVDGLRSANDLHWLHAYGLVDRDDRSDEDIAKLQETGTFALTVHSTESIYYSAAAMGWLARRQAETFGSSAEGLLKAATEVALATLKDEETMLRLCARRCERLVRSKVLSQMPDWREIQAGADIAISAPVQESYHEEVAMYRVMIESGNLEGLISRYAVRESGALSAIATKFEFSSRPKYEQAVLALASSEADFRDELRALIGPLAAEIGVV